MIRRHALEPLRGVLFAVYIYYDMCVVKRFVYL